MNKRSRVMRTQRADQPGSAAAEEKLDPSTSNAELSRLAELDYKTTFDAWRQLVDIRFKLIALVPTGSMVGVAQVLPWPAYAAGMLFLCGITLYEIRNTQVHDALGKRLVQLDGEFANLESTPRPAGGGPFSTRPSGRLRLFGVFSVWHNRAIAIVYATSIAAWTWRLLASWRINIHFASNGRGLAALGAAIIWMMTYREIIRLSKKSD
ncbi:hypothetical protein GCM10020358_69210 [Amorphoplanes nipponensis]|uniref:Uncharacterized protein n=1 Tax=Actinoplanes nipponensis TaxID=135950 RepID=A0A919JLV6_9ACTN|nr:hypothetical protein [Actinoplanes nipponensis]GIE53188.1 hypothetical protein Ani05nite_67220 [Actinoplanes nipponensis]